MTFNDIAQSIPRTAVTQIDHLPFPRLASGKVREIFDLGDTLLITATDRLSAFDVILPDGIPGKGIVLTQMSLWWFARTQGLISEPPVARPGGPNCWRGIPGPRPAPSQHGRPKAAAPSHRVRRARIPRRQRVELLPEDRLGLRP